MNYINKRDKYLSKLEHSTNKKNIYYQKVDFYNKKIGFQTGGDALADARNKFGFFIFKYLTDFIAKQDIWFERGQETHVMYRKGIYKLTKASKEYEKLNDPCTDESITNLMKRLSKLTLDDTAQSVTGDKNISMLGNIMDSNNDKFIKGFRDITTLCIILKLKNKCGVYNYDKGGEEDPFHYLNDQTINKADDELNDREINDCHNDLLVKYGSNYTAPVPVPTLEAPDVLNNIVSDLDRMITNLSSQKRLNMALTETVDKYLTVIRNDLESYRSMTIDK